MTTYIPIVFLKVQHPFKIERTSELNCGMLMLHLRGYEENAQEFRTFLLPRSYHREFRRVIRLNRERNGETAVMKLKYYGPQFWGDPIIRISDRGFVTYLR